MNSLKSIYTKNRSKTCKNNKNNKNTIKHKSGAKKCYIENMADSNMRIIKGRRRYITKNFNLDASASSYINKIVSAENTINCIKIARILDDKLKKLKTRKLKSN